MIYRGDCLCCSKIKVCALTSVEKALGGFTCQYFEGVIEAEWMARMDAMEKFGDVISVQAMMDRVIDEENEDGPDF